MKKLTAILLTVLVLTVLTACRGKEDEHINFGTLIPTSTRSVLVEHTSGESTVSYTAEKHSLEALEGWLSSLKCELRHFEHGNAPDAFEGGESYTFTTEKASFSYIKNGENDCYLKIKDGWYFVKNPTDPPEFELLSTEENTVLKNEHDNAKAVFVRDRLYVSTETESTVEGRCGNMDGEITASVPADEMPTKNGESNFGTGCTYQVTGANTIDVFIDGKIIVFRCYDNVGRLWVSRADEESEKPLSEDDEARVRLLLAEGEWQSTAPDCLFDCVIGGDDGRIYYHSACGALFNVQSGEACALSPEDKELLNGILAQHIRLGTE